jgi:thiamine biosynthesis lipoprotein
LHADHGTYGQLSPDPGFSRQVRPVGPAGHRPAGRLIMRHQQIVMGTSMSVDIRDSGCSAAVLRGAIQRAFAVLEADDRRFSTYRDASEVSRVNNGRSALQEASPELLEVLRIGAELEVLSNGAFSCHDPDGQLDPSGIVKGWSAQRAANVLTEAGLRSFCLNAGGDVVVRGEPEPGRPWQVAIRNPDGAAALPLAVLAVRDQSVATSATYERGQHLWDGRTGQAATGLASVTVVADDLTWADALATAVFALGPHGVSWAVEHFDCRVLAWSTSGQLITGGDVRPLLA